MDLPIDAIKFACQNILGKSSGIKNPEKEALIRKVSQIYESCIEAQFYPKVPKDPLLIKLVSNLEDFDDKEFRRIVISRILSEFDTNQNSAESHTLAEQIFRRIYPKVKFSENVDVRVTDLNNQSIAAYEKPTSFESQKLERTAPVDFHNLDSEDLSIERLTTAFENELRNLKISKESAQFISSQFQTTLNFLMQKVEKHSLTPEDAALTIKALLRAKIEENNQYQEDIDVQTFKDLAGNKIEGGQGSPHSSAIDSPEFRILIKEINAGTWKEGTRTITLKEIPEYEKERTEKALDTLISNPRTHSLIQDLFTSN